MIYRDSSFIVPLFFYEKGFSQKARKMAAAWREAPLVSPLAELEFTNSVGRKVYGGEIAIPDGQKVIREFRQDFEAGIFQWGQLNLAAMFRDAIKLSWQRTPTDGNRSLDIQQGVAANWKGG